MGTKKLGSKNKERLDQFDRSLPKQSKTKRQTQRFHNLKAEQMEYVRKYNRALANQNRKKQREHYTVIAKYEKMLDEEMIQ